MKIYLTLDDLHNMSYKNNGYLFLKVQNEWDVFKNNSFFFENKMIHFEND